MPKRKKEWPEPPARPIPYWLGFYTFVDGQGTGSAKVSFKVDAGSGDLGKAALALIQRRLFEDDST
jgi:hypothetical protein